MNLGRRSFYRFATVASVSLHVLGQDEVEEARLRVRARGRGLANPLAVVEDVLTSAEQHASLVLMQRVLFALERLNRRVDDLLALQAHGKEAEGVARPAQPISLSGSGFALRADLLPEVGALIEARIDMWENGLPLIHCLCRVVSVQKGGKMNEIAFNFEELMPEDRERIVQLALRRQSLERREAQREPAS